VVRLSVRARIFLLLKPSKPNLLPTDYPTECDRGKATRNLRFTVHTHLVRRLRISGILPPRHYLFTSYSGIHLYDID